MGKYVPYNIWFIILMGAQGYTIKNNVIYQDNQSKIRVEKNGKIHVQETLDTYISDISS